MIESLQTCSFVSQYWTQHRVQSNILWLNLQIKIKRVGKNVFCYIYEFDVEQLQDTKSSAMHKV